MYLYVQWVPCLVKGVKSIVVSLYVASHLFLVTSTTQDAHDICAPSFDNLVFVIFLLLILKETEIG